MDDGSEDCESERSRVSHDAILRSKIAPPTYIYDTRLFESGNLADVEVKRGDSTWKLHKAILCNRSVWFKKALTGPFKVRTLWSGMIRCPVSMLTMRHQETETGTVTLEEKEQCDIDCFLKFIYTGSIHLQKSYPGDDAFVALMRIWKTADYFVHEPLRDLVVRAANDHAQEQAQFFCTAFPGADHVKEVDNVVENSFNPAVSLLYTEEMEPLRETFLPIYMTMAVASVHGLSKSKAFSSLLHDFPRFAADWATELMRGFRKWKPVNPRRAGGCCNQCGEYMGGRGTVDTLKWVRDEYMMVLCDRCYRVPALAEWESTRK